MATFLGWLTRRTTASSSESKPVPVGGDAAPKSPAAVPKLNMLRASAEHVVQLAAVSKDSAATQRTARTKREVTKTVWTKTARTKSAAGKASVGLSQALIVAPPSDFTSFLSQKARVVMEGRMNKLKGRGVGKSWVPQHFILKADAFYYTPNKQFSHKEKKVSLVKTKIGTAQHYTKKDNAFGIMDMSSRSLHIMCVESESLMHEWIKALIAVRTALEGRARDSQPNAALALNSRYPHIPSLPPPPSAATSPAGQTTTETRPTYVAHLTDSEGEGEKDEGSPDDDEQGGAPNGAGALMQEPPRSRPPAAPQPPHSPHTQHARRAKLELRAPAPVAAAGGITQRADDPLGLTGLSPSPTTAAAGVARLNLTDSEQDSDVDSDFALAVTIQPNPMRARRAPPEAHQCGHVSTGTQWRGSVISPARQRTPLAAPAPQATPRDGAVRAVLVGASVMGQSAAYHTQMVRMELVLLRHDDSRAGTGGLCGLWE